MKLLKSTLLFAALFMTAYTASAQFSLGPMLVYGTETDLGFGIKTKFAATDQILISPSFAFLTSTKLLGIKVSSSELNADGQYYFNPDGDTQFYGLAGLNLIFSSISGAGSSDASSSQIGLNIGAGADFGIADSIQGFTQAKYTLSKADQLSIHAGVYFSFGGS